MTNQFGFHNFNRNLWGLMIYALSKAIVEEFRSARQRSICCFCKAGRLYCNTTFKQDSSFLAGPPFYNREWSTGTQLIVAAHSLCVAPLYTLTCFFYVILLFHIWYRETKELRSKSLSIWIGAKTLRGMRDFLYQFFQQMPLKSIRFVIPF